ncbi:MAG: hypothetical protein IT423_21465 [Pirellulaceae bacterium]|nr:hypothetical protein [Pirellulaceae bacterium]
MRRRHFASLASVGLIAALAPRSGKCSESAAAISPLAGSAEGPWRRLFLDSSVIEQKSGVVRKFHAAEKLDQSIVIRDRPWEGVSAITGPYVYGTVLHEGDRYRLWYQILFQGNHVGYAESTDGVHWAKPELDVVTYEGKPTNLVVSEFDTAKTGGVCHNPTVIPRPHDPDPNRRYALYGYDGKAGHARVAFSPDGIHWRYPAASFEQGLFSSSDVVNFGFDPDQRRYFSTWKTRNRRGRAVGIAWSADGESWVKPFEGPVFVADDLDPDDTQIYGMPAFAYQGLYVGTPWIYRARYFRYGQYSVDKLHEAQSDSTRTMDIQLAWSWDQVNWTRPPERDQFIPRGKAGSWNGGMIVTASAPVVVGNQLHFYYGGTDRVHDEKRAAASIGLATLRLDGFCSMVSESPAAQDGWLITRREPMLTPRVMINAKTSARGEVTAELLNRKNKVVSGFSREECIPFRGDSVDHSLRWKSDRLPSDGTQRDYKIRFWLNEAELFSYLPEALDPQQKDLARFPIAGP